jgi:hypothetical protein
MDWTPMQYGFGTAGLIALGLGITLLVTGHEAVGGILLAAAAGNAVAAGLRRYGLQRALWQVVVTHYRQRGFTVQPVPEPLDDPALYSRAWQITDAEGHNALVAVWTADAPPDLGRLFRLRHNRLAGWMDRGLAMILVTNHTCDPRVKDTAKTYGIQLLDRVDVARW